MNWVCYNGKIISLDELQLNPFNRSFLFGDGWFDSLRVCESDIPLWPYHYVRNRKTALALGMDTSSFPDGLTWKDNLIELCRKNGHTDARLRISFFRAGAGLYTPESNNFEWIASSSPVLDGNEPVAQSALLGISSYRKNPGVLSEYKISSSIIYVLAALERKSMGMDELILLNDQHKVVETIAGNLFWFESGRLHCPPLSDGSVDGVFRQYVLNQCHKIGVDFFEKSVSLAELKNADAVFYCNAVSGIFPVSKIEDKVFGTDLVWQIRSKMQSELWS